MGQQFATHRSIPGRLCLLCSLLLRKNRRSMILIAKASYFEEVPAVVGRKNVFGMQFHPEKSSHLGVELLQNFTELI